ncbi:acyl-CoA synthetase [Polyangium sorediatum]|uniref:Long-chain fatty acid--CoA ligase n=1 Tax=Polyangium sorediatum TaxID=889274 RepID=A0ABT6NRD8_9BACT|nr:long-chain fatty acid--CoA ligase [Polyangium sorediatum]MDI1430875.1 long-chain fatty acid--CoA ligase [Polyangium sorediatum]
MHLGDWLGRRAALTPDKVALLDNGAGGRPLTYRAWDHTANRTAHFLRERLGVRRGDRVAALAMNDVVMLDLWFACGKLGAIFTPLNYRLTPGELGQYLAATTPEVLVYGPAFAATSEALRREASFVPRVFVATHGASRARGDDVDLGERDAATDRPPPALQIGWDEPWVLCGTGGTTGTPKAAMLTYRSITANAVNTISSFSLSSSDVALLNAPLFHTGGLNVFTAPLVLAGGTSVVCRAFDPDEVYTGVRDQGVTVFFGVPTMFLALSQHRRFAEGELRSLRICISGGAPCPEPLFHTYWERGIDLKTGYGLTEAGPNNFWLPPADVRRKVGSVGAPLFFVEARVVDAARESVRPGEVGELEVRGPHVFGGYWGRPEETAKVLVAGDGGAAPLAGAKPPNDGRWLRTGDLARCDDEGHFYIAGRSKDLLISGGENVYPAEVEAVLAAHPSVAEAALLGVPHEKWGQVGRAIVVLAPGAPPDAESILAHCRARLAKYKVPQSVVFVDALPRTGAGKIDKKALEKQHG